MQDVVKLLANTTLFADIHKSHKRQIAEVMERKEYRAGQVILKAGESGDGLFVIESGKVSVFVNNEQMNVDFEIDRLGEGQVFGEMALLSKEPTNSSVRAVEPTTCLILPRKVFARICNQLPQVTLGIAATLSVKLNAMSQQQGVSFISLSSMRVDPDAYHLVPAQILQRHRMIPLRMDGATLTLGMVNPSNTLGFDDVRRVLSGVEVRPVAISEDDYQSYLRRNVKTLVQDDGDVSTAGLSGADRPGSHWQSLQVHSSVDDAVEERGPSQVAGREVIALVNQLLAEAIDREASDLHIDLERSGVKVRYRVDGRLRPREQAIPGTHHRALISRIKVLAGMDIAEKRLPQDGRISVSYRDREFDLRVATMPARNGERLAMRLLEAATSILDIGQIMLAKELTEVVRRMIFKPIGAVLVTGPTGSGKTTTLYSLLRERTRQSDDMNIVTVEDPVEYDLPGISQVQVNESIGLTFPEVLRGFLRHDPDIILIGETRDEVTARIAMEAALTGHLVLTSMHTTSALGSVIRLKEMGVPTFLIANALTGVISQRLVRRCCPMCTQPYNYPSSVMENLVRTGVLAEGDELPMVKGAGCETCGGTGFRGRVGVFEVLQITESLRQLIAEDAPMSRMREEADGRGMVNLVRFSSFLLENRLTVPSEVLGIMAIED